MLKKIEQAPATNTREDFVSKAGTREVKGPRRKGRKLSDATVDYVKMMWFGPAGVGKTHLIGQFVEKLGKRVALISTDIGDSGHLTIKTQLKNAGRLDLLDNVYLLELQGFKEVSAFLQDPYKFDPALWEHDPDILAWDGFSSFQQVDISEHVGDMRPADKANGEQRDRGDFREEGVIFEQADWGAVKNYTVRKGNSFLGIRHPSGKPLHKIVTCFEAITYKPADSSKPTGAQVVAETYKPMLQGAGGHMLLGGFDLIMRCKTTTKREGDSSRREYSLVTQGSQNLVAKNRGFDLAPEIPADAAFLWEKILEGIGSGVLTKAK